MESGNLGRFIEVAGPDIAGRAGLKADLRANLKTLDVTGDIDGYVREFKPLHPYFDTLVCEGVIFRPHGPCRGRRPGSF